MKVKVAGAPGYISNFEGELKVDNPGFPRVVVETVWEGKPTLVTVPRECLVHIQNGM